jgi:hypothetical protein
VQRDYSAKLLIARCAIPFAKPVRLLMSALNAQVTDLEYQHAHALLGFSTMGLALSARNALGRVELATKKNA